MGDTVITATMVARAFVRQFSAALHASGIEISSPIQVTNPLRALAIDHKFRVGDLTSSFDDVLSEWTAPECDRLIARLKRNGAEAICFVIEGDETACFDGVHARAVCSRQSVEVAVKFVIDRRRFLE